MPSSPINSNNELYVRRCHICGVVNGQGEEITQCESCGYHFAPYFYFDYKRIEDYSQFRKEWAPHFRPVIGLSVYWKPQEPNGNHESQPR